MRYYEETEEEQQWQQEHNYMLIWKCPACDYEYRDYPHTNERCLCPECKVPCVQSGETYMG
jgi:predicted Zn-ribbon and HTH transcriptional regulator